MHVLRAPASTGGFHCVRERRERQQPTGAVQVKGRDWRESPRRVCQRCSYCDAAVWAQ